MRSSLIGLRVAIASLAVLPALLVVAWGASQPAQAASGGPSSSTLKAARAALAPYTGHPSAFPATQALAKRPAKGSLFVYLQCGTPVCAQIAQLLAAPTKALGVKLTIVNAGLTATSSQTAVATALADKPVAVLLPAVDPQLFGGTLKHLRSAGIAVTAVGMLDGTPYGVQEEIGGTASVELAGRLMADWVIVHKGASANVVYFGTPELNFSALMQKSFESTITKDCPSCHVASSSITVLTYGSTAPADVVSYLQAHPGTNAAVFASMEAATGLAAALKDASLNITTLGFAPTQSNLQDIKDGGLTVGLGLDLSVQEWLQVDVTARLLAHQKTAASNLNVDLEFLTKAGVTKTDTVEGWTGYPNAAQRFAKLWPSSK